jgi:hypothetical protein
MHKAHLPCHKYMKLTRKLQAHGDENRNTRVWRLQKESCGSSYSVMIFLFENQNPPTDSTTPVLPVPSPPPPIAAACYFPSSSIKNSTKLTHISTKIVVVLLHPLNPPVPPFPLSFSVVHRYNQSLFCFCVRAKSVCVFALPCSSVSLRWVCARPRARVLARAKKERGKNRERESEEVYGD